jgi:hypothetical protein
MMIINRKVKIFDQWTPIVKEAGMSAITITSVMETESA